MQTDRIAEATITINAPPDAVWRALLDPAAIKEYMFGATVHTDWNEGSEIRWQGEWHGKKFEDKGKILQVVPGKRLSYSHFSPLSGRPDAPGNYHIITIVLAQEGLRTTLTLTQDNNPDDEAREHSEQNWGSMLMALKRRVEASLRQRAGS